MGIKNKSCTEQSVQRQLPAKAVNCVYTRPFGAMKKKESRVVTNWQNWLTKNKLPISDNTKNKDC